MNRLTNLSVVLLLALIWSCGGLSKLQKGQLAYKVDPPVLEARGGVVEATISLTIPPKVFGKAVTVKAVPVLKFGDETLELEAKSLQGESVEGNAQVINYAAGGRVEHTISFEYREEMSLSKLYVRLDAEEKGKTATIENFVADGISTVLLLPNDMTIPQMFGFIFERDKESSYASELQYQINKARVQKSELDKEDYKNLLNKLNEVNEKDNFEIKSLNIVGYASPDGSTKINDPLANKRSESATSSVKKGVEGLEVEGVSKGEDWEGFQKLVKSSSIPDKDLILRVLSMYTDPDERDQQIKNLTQVYEPLKDDIWPLLRRSEINLTVLERGKPDDKIIEMARQDMASLTADEILQAISLSTDMQEQFRFIKKAVGLFPNDARLVTDMGVVHLIEMRYQEAIEHFEKAQGMLRGPNAQLLNNMATAELRQGNIDKASELITSAYNRSGGDVVIKINKGIVDIIKGDFVAAKGALSGTNTVYESILFVAERDWDRALSILDKAPDVRGLGSYVKAIIGARTDDTSVMYNALKDAIARNPMWKEKAQKDVDFMNYFQEEAFTQIVN